MEEEYVSLAELKVILEKEKAARGELNPEQQYALSHGSTFAKIDAAKVPAMVKELMEIPMMSQANAVKIADLLSTTVDDVRAIFAKERFSLSKEDADKVLDDCVYVRDLRCPELMQHRTALRNSTPEPETAPASGWIPDTSKLMLVGGAAALALGLLGYFQVRELRRRRG